MKENKYNKMRFDIINERDNGTKWSNSNDFYNVMNMITMEEALVKARVEIFDEFDYKLNRLKKENQELLSDVKVCEDEDIKQRDIINEYKHFNYKHRFIIKVLSFIDNIKLPRIKIEWRL